MWEGIQNGCSSNYEGSTAVAFDVSIKIGCYRMRLGCTLKIYVYRGNKVGELCLHQLETNNDYRAADNSGRSDCRLRS